MLTDYIDRGARINPGGVALTTADGSATLTHAEFEDLTHRVAASLRQRGLAGQAKVAVYSPNDPLAMVAVVGVLRAGCAWVALNPRAGQDELTHLLDAVGCDALLSHASLEAAVTPLLDSSATIREHLTFGGGGPLELPGWLHPPDTRVGAPDASLAAPAMMLGSGGTTGPPKAVVATNRQLLAMCWAFHAHMPEPAPPVYLMATPMTHAAGAVAWPVLADGGAVVVHDGVDPVRVFDSIERHRVTRLFLPPTAIYALLAHPAVREPSYKSLRNFVYAAAPMSVDKLVEALDVFGPVMAQTYGQAEAPMICTCLTPAEHVDALASPERRDRLSSCGRPSVVASVAVMDDDGRVAPAGERGEIVVRGSLVMDGYYGNPEATADVRRPGGWHGTGDVGFHDGDGFYYIVDRKKDMIISGGFNVYPSEIEQVVWSHPEVVDCAVIGVPDDKWGEAVTAVVEVREGADVDAQELITHCKAQLGSIRAPKSVVFRELPRSPNGKVLKRVLRDEYWDGRARQV